MDKHYPVLIVGGSFGGVSAALAVARLGIACAVVEETAWLGGQATGQGVPLDEHPWIEQYGATRSYRSYCEGIRAYYRRNYPLTGKAMRDPALNPGAAWVTRLGYEPRVGRAVLEEMLAPYRTQGLIDTYFGWHATAAAMDGDRVKAVTFESGADTLTLSARYVLDATELGDLLPLTGAEHRIGAESQAQTGEPLALEGEPEPLRQQPFTHLLAVSYHPGEEHVIDKPDGYEAFLPDFERIRGHMTEAEEKTGEAKMAALFPAGASRDYVPSIWNFRRAFCRANFEGFASDITMLMNGNEYRRGVLLGVPEAEKERHLREAKRLSLSLLYYLQTAVPDGYRGGKGFPGLRPRGDVFETADGLAQYAYIRESRRMEAEFMVLEQHFRMDAHPDAPMRYPDSVGLGGYRIDIHEQRKGKSITLSSHGQHWTQQIPLGALIPVRLENLLPACKNLGVTHVTNGAFRLHPVEWNIGEAAGTLAAHCLLTDQTPRQVRNTAEKLEDFQRLLTRMGVELDWPHATFGRSYFSHFEKVPGWTFGDTSLEG